MANPILRQSGPSVTRNEGFYEPFRGRVEKSADISEELHLHLTTGVQPDFCSV